MILDVWIYISDKVFSNIFTNYQKSINIILAWLLSAGALFIINKYANILSTNNLYNSNYIYILTLLFIPIVHFFISKVNFSYFYKIVIHFLVILWIVYIIRITSLSDNILYYYLMVWFTEEFIKYSLSNNIYLSKAKLKSDILLFGLISWIWFWLVENFIYMYNYLAWDQTLSFWLFLITRWVFGFMVHVIFTSLLCYGIYVYYSAKNMSDNNTNIYKKNILYIAYFLVFICISWLWHAFYDIYVWKYLIISWILVLFLWYIWISYLFFISDRRYYE